MLGAILKSMKNSDVLKKEYICIDVDLSSKEEVLMFICNLAKSMNVILDSKVFYQSVLEREKMSATGLMNGIAIPHGISETVKEASVFYVRLKKPIKWESMDGSDIKHVFLLTIPKDTKDNIHLKMLSQLARSLMDINIVKNLDLASNPSEILNILRKGEEMQ